jgi:hypothetical protein
MQLPDLSFDPRVEQSFLDKEVVVILADIQRNAREGTAELSTRTVMYRRDCEFAQVCQFAKCL